MRRFLKENVHWRKIFASNIYLKFCILAIKPDPLIPGIYRLSPCFMFTEFGNCEEDLPSTDCRPTGKQDKIFRIFQKLVRVTEQFTSLNCYILCIGKTENVTFEAQ